MDLAAYLERESLTQAEFARRLQCSQGLVNQWMKGKTRITGERARQIERVTDGDVQAWELRPDLFDAPGESGGTNGTSRAGALP